MVERRKKETSVEVWTRIITDLEGAVVVSALLAMLGGSLWYLLNNELPKTNEIMLSMILGMLVTKISTIVDYRYGGSQQSKKQTETNAVLANTAQAAQAIITDAAKITPGKVELSPGDKVEVKAEDIKNEA